MDSHLVKCAWHGQIKVFESFMRKVIGESSRPLLALQHALFIIQALKCKENGHCGYPMTKSESHT